MALRVCVYIYSSPHKLENALVLRTLGLLAVVEVTPRVEFSSGCDQYRQLGGAGIVAGEGTGEKNTPA